MTSKQKTQTGIFSKASDTRTKQAAPASVMIPRIMFIASASLLVIVGLIMVYSASSISTMTDPEIADAAYYFKNQLKYVIIGIVVVLITLAIPYEFWNGPVCWIPWVIVVVLLGVTAIMGVVGLGAQRWVTLGPLGGFQASEFAKIALLLIASNLVSRFQGGDLSFQQFVIQGLLAVVVPFVLILAQPDLGTAIIVFFSVLLVLWFGEIDFRPILLLLGGVIIAGVIAILVSPYRRQRFVAAFSPWSDPLGDGYQVINSLYAFASGGIFGVGLGMSRQKYNYLPEAHTDFIFAVIGEELGLFGATIIILLFVAFVYAGVCIARQAPSLFGQMVAGSATATIGIQAFINIACTIGLFPVTGKPLPFISSGGSSLLATLILTGLVLSVSFHSHLPDEASQRRMDMRVIPGGASREGGGRGNKAVFESSPGRKSRTPQTSSSSRLPKNPPRDTRSARYNERSKTSSGQASRSSARSGQRQDNQSGRGDSSAGRRRR